VRDVALALGAEKMNIPDKARAFAIFEGGWDVSRAEENYAALLRMGEGVTPPPGSESDRPYSLCMRVSASVVRSVTHRGLDEPEKNACRLAAQQAYETAGPGPADMDVAEVHDASAMGEILQAENLGFVPPTRCRDAGSIASTTGSPGRGAW
jgi:hypothetical protein